MPTGGGPLRIDAGQRGGGAQMETTSRAGRGRRAQRSHRRGGARRPGGRSTAICKAPFPWYGLDEAFTGPRWLMQVGAAADGTVEHGSTGHGEEPSLRAEPGRRRQRFAVVVTVASRPVRHSADGTGVLEATSVSSAAWLAGSGPAGLHLARRRWTTPCAGLAGPADRRPPGSSPTTSAGTRWSTLSLPVDGVPADFHYRESEYGWVLAGSAPGGRAHRRVRARHERVRPGLRGDQGHRLRAYEALSAGTRP